MRDLIYRVLILWVYAVFWSKPVHLGCGLLNDAGLTRDTNAAHTYVRILRSDGLVMLSKMSLRCFFSSKLPVIKNWLRCRELVKLTAATSNKLKQSLRNKVYLVPSVILTIALSTQAPSSASMNPFCCKMRKNFLGCQKEILCSYT